MEPRQFQKRAKPWWCSELIQLQKTVTKLCNNGRSKTEYDWAEFKTFQLECKNMIRYDKNNACIAGSELHPLRILFYKKIILELDWEIVNTIKK